MWVHPPSGGSELAAKLRFFASPCLAPGAGIPYCMHAHWQDRAHRGGVKHRELPCTSHGQACHIVCNPWAGLPCTSHEQVHHVVCNPCAGLPCASHGQAPKLYAIHGQACPAHHMGRPQYCDNMLCAIHAQACPAHHMGKPPYCMQSMGAFVNKKLHITIMFFLESRCSTTEEIVSG